MGSNPSEKIELVESIFGGTIIKCFETDSCDDNDSNNITLILNSIAAKSFALYAAEKGSSTKNG